MINKSERRREARRFHRSSRGRRALRLEICTAPKAFQKLLPMDIADTPPYCSLSQLLPVPLASKRKWELFSIGADKSRILFIKSPVRYPESCIYAKRVVGSSPMKMAPMVALLLALPALGSGDGCRATANSLMHSYFWERLGRYSEGVSPGGIRTRELKSDEVSEGLREVMSAIEKSGGFGRYARVRFTDGQVEAVRVVHPPSDDLYGGVFGEVFRRLNSRNVPVFVRLGKLESALVVEKFGSSNAEAAFFTSPKGGNIERRKAFRYIRDLVVSAEEFRRALPDVPASVVALLERKESGGALEAEEEKLFRMAVGLPNVLIETRAYEAAVMDIFNGTALRDFVSVDDNIFRFSKRLGVLGDYTFVAPTNAAIGNFRLLVALLHIDPTNPGVLVSGAKVALFGSAALGGGIIVLEGIEFLLSGPLFLADLWEVFLREFLDQVLDRESSGSQESP